jgi:glutamine synthetase
MTPESTGPHQAEELLSRGARSLLVTLADNAGLLRAKVVPSARISAAATKGIGLSPVFAVMCGDSAITSSSNYGGPMGDMRLVPDLTAAACIDGGAGLWWAPVDQRDQELNELASCQRSALRRQVDAASNVGLEYLMTFELEFTLFSGDRDNPDFAHQGPSYGLQAFLATEEFSLDLLEQMTNAGLDPELVHPEYGPGQVEFSLAPSDPITAADRQVLARLITHRTARRHGLMASFSPVLVLGQVGNGCHVHFSAFSDGVNVFSNQSNLGVPTSELAGQMIGGLVDELPSATGLFAPSPLSYERLVPGHWAGAYACWGVENREAAVRFIPGTSVARANAANCEVKTADCTANPYLVAAAILAMTLRGVRSRTKLPDPVSGDPADLSDGERDRHHAQRLPQSLDQALDLLAKSPAATEAVGPELLEAFSAVRRHDLETFGNLEPQKRIEALRWLF